ncbi:MAG: Macrolide export ATP-binding/permease protein MacB [Acidobacteria bacterium ADurb.Bin051]|jgi:putative ABC transport system ATP-binding protein|nr:MAG: Macrolide export ATP-binding/permease protein MacB [Acidobacteria bacterium ADurb.Bin051]
MIQLRGIHKSYWMGTNRLHVLRGIDLDIAPGEFVAIMGASGSGKSTLMNVLGLLDNYDEGEYRFDGELYRDLSETRSARIRSERIGFVFQSFHLIPFKTALSNVALPLYYRKVPRRERLGLAAEYLARVGLADRATHLPRELSGGQQQRVAIARALISRPRILLADEPTGALDSQTSREIMAVLQDVQSEGVAVVIVTHEHAIASMTDRVIHLVDGEIASDRRQQRRPALDVPVPGLESTPSRIAAAS